MSQKWRVITTIIFWSATLSLSLVSVVNAQELSWVKMAGSTALDQGFGIDVDAAGNVYVSGSFQEEITFERGNVTESTHSSAGAFDNYIAKYNVEGALLWTVSFGGAGQDRVYELALDGNGDVVVVGSFEESVVFGLGEANETTLNSLGSSDIFVSKYNPEGLLLWARQAGGGSEDTAFTLGIDSDGNSFIGGNYRIQATFGSGEDNETELNSQGVEDMYMAKYNPDGLLVWVRGAGGSSSDYANSIAVDDAGNSVVTGTFSGVATFAPGETNEMTLDSGTSLGNLFLAKYDVDGMLLWAKRAGGNSGGNLSATNSNRVAMDVSGNSYVTGSFGETATFGEGEANEVTLTSLGSIDIFIAKYDPDGVLLWVKHPEGVGHDVGRSLVLDSSGDFFLVGDFEDTIVLGPGESNQTTFSSFGAFLAKYDTAGALVWARPVGSGSGVVAFSHVIDASGNIYLTGVYWGDTTFGAGESNETDFTSAGLADIFVAKYNTDIQISIDSPSSTTTDFKLNQNYPNPFSHATTISFAAPAGQQVALHIYNLEGRLVRRLVQGDVLSGQQSITWDGRDDEGRRVSNGAYFLKLIAGELGGTKTLILLR